MVAFPARGAEAILINGGDGIFLEFHRERGLPTRVAGKGPNLRVADVSGEEEAANGFGVSANGGEVGEYIAEEAVNGRRCP